MFCLANFLPNLPQIRCYNAMFRMKMSIFLIQHDEKKYLFTLVYKV